MEHNKVCNVGLDIREIKVREFNGNNIAGNLWAMLDAELAYYPIRYHLYVWLRRFITWDIWEGIERKMSNEFDK